MPRKSLALFVCATLLLVFGAAAAFAYTVTYTDVPNNGQYLLVKATESGKVESADTENQQGLSMFSAGKYDQAIRHYNEAIKLDHKNVKAYNNRGVTYSKMGEYHRAIADYTRALRLDPKFAQAYENRALAYFRTKDYSRSCSDLRAFEKLGGRPSPAFTKDLENAAGTGRC